MRSTAIMKGHRSGGFTLLELTMALAIIAIGLLGMARMQLSAISGNAFGGRMTTAIALAQNQMEDFMNQDLEGSGAPFDPAANPWPALGTQATATGTVDDPTVWGERYGSYRLNWSVEANAPIDDVATLTVQVQQLDSMKAPVTLTCIKRR